MYRQIDTGTWDDPWFAELDPDAKLLFLYLLTNRRSTAAGVFEITARAMSFETGLDAERVRTALASILTRVQWWPEHQVVWVKNFLRHQAVSPKFYMSAWNEMREMPDEIRESVGQVYPILTRDEKPPEKKEDIETLLIPYPKGIDTVSEPSRKTSTSTSLEKTSRLDTAADAARLSPPASSPTPQPKPSKPRTAKQQAADALYSRRLALFEAWCRGIGLDPDSEEALVGRDVAFRQLKPIQNGPQPTVEDFEACTRFMVSQEWRDQTPAIPTVIKDFGGWVAKGKPARAEKVGGLSVLPGTPNPNKRGGYTAGELMQLAEQERRRESS